MTTQTAFKAHRPLFDQVVLRASDLFNVRRSALREPEFTPFSTFARISQSTAIGAAFKVTGNITLNTAWTTLGDGLFTWRTARVWVYSESIGWLAKRWVHDGDRQVGEFLVCQPDGAPLVFPDADSAMLFVQAIYAARPSRLGAIAWKWDGGDD